MKIIKNFLAFLMLSFVSCTPAYALSQNDFLIPSFIEIELTKFRTLTILPEFAGEKRQLFIIEVTWNYLTEEEVFEELKDQVTTRHKVIFDTGKTYAVYVFQEPLITELTNGEYVYTIVFGIIELGQEV